MWVLMKRDSKGKVFPLEDTSCRAELWKEPSGLGPLRGESLMPGKSIDFIPGIRIH